MIGDIKVLVDLCEKDARADLVISFGDVQEKTCEMESLVTCH
jgi:hypothetical protein